MAERLRNGDVIQLTISDLAATGKAVGRYNGMVVMADGGLPGEVIECQIIKVKRSFAMGKCLNLLEESDYQFTTLEQLVLTLKELTVNLTESSQC